MAFAGLMDGGLSVTIGGTERKTAVQALEWESTGQGDGGASFWLPVTDPFAVKSQYPELYHGVGVQVTHTYDAKPAKTLYKGYILSDPRVGYAGEKAYLNVQCGGVLEVAKWRTDTAFIFTDSDNGAWFEVKRNPKWAVCDNSESLYLGVEDGVVVRKYTPNVAAGMGYVAYKGCAYMANSPSVSGLYAAKRLRAKATWNLKDNMKAGLYWAPDYKRGKQPSDFTEITTWGPNTTGKGVAVDQSFGGTNGAGYVVLFLWKTVDDKKPTTGERFIELENPELYLTSDGNEKNVMGAMLAVANFVGLHGSTDTAAIGSVLQDLLVRPYTDPARAMQDFAAQANVLVDWGWHQGVFRAKPMATNPATIRTLANYFKVDASLAGVKWDVRQHPEEENVGRVVRLIYGRRGKSNWPAGYPATVAWPKSPALNGGTAFQKATAPIVTVNFSDHKLGEANARSTAKRLWRHLGKQIQQSGSCIITRQTVLDKDSQAYPAPYMHGGDWVECTTGSAGVNPGPLFIKRCHVQAATGRVEMDVGLASDALVRQLEAAGRVTRVRLAPRKKGTRSG
jgi:hypothetical protein